MCLSGCATTTERVIITETEFVCPQIEPWDKDAQKRAADDLLYLPKSSPVFDFLASAIRLRDQIEAACPDDEDSSEPNA